MDSQIQVISSVEDIRNRVYWIRGKQVMLDFDLAEIYGYEVKRLNEQVKRNNRRFPEDFMFQLTSDEIDLMKSRFVNSRETQDDNLKSQFATSSWGGKRKLPYGAAKKYAEELSRRTEIACVSYEEIDDINIYGTIIYIGSLYANGLGVDGNEEQAEFWTQKADAAEAE